MQRQVLRVAAAEARVFINRVAVVLNQQGAVGPGGFYVDGGLIAFQAHECEIGVGSLPGDADRPLLLIGAEVVTRALPHDGDGQRAHGRICHRVGACVAGGEVWLWPQGLLSGIGCGWCGGRTLFAGTQK